MARGVSPEQFEKVEDEAKKGLWEAEFALTAAARALSPTA